MGAGGGRERGILNHYELPIRLTLYIKGIDMFKFIVKILLCFLASQSYSAELEITAEGWNNYGSILKFGVTDNRGKIDAKYIERIASSMVQSRGRRDEFLDHEIQNIVRPKTIGVLKSLLPEQQMPGKKVQYTLRSFIGNGIEYEFKTGYLCFYQASNISISNPWDNSFPSWHSLIDSKMEFSNAVKESNWLTGFRGNFIHEKNRNTYCIKVSNTNTAKMLKNDLAQYYTGKKVIAIIDADIVGKDVYTRFGDYLFTAITKPTNVRIVSTQSNETLYETNDVFVK